MHFRVSQVCALIKIVQAITEAKLLLKEARTNTGGEDISALNMVFHAMAYWGDIPEASRRSTRRRQVEVNPLARARVLYCLFRSDPANDMEESRPILTPPNRE